MTHITHILRSVLIVSFMLLLSPSAIADDDPVQLDPITDISSGDLEIDGNNVYVHNLKGWNTVAQYYQKGENLQQIQIDGGNYEFPTTGEEAKNVKIIIDYIIECDYDSETGEGSNISYIQNFLGELTMASNCYITGAVKKSESCYMSGLLVNMNFGTINGIRIKDLTVYSKTHVYSWQNDGIICGINQNNATIKNCEVINTTIQYNGFNSTDNSDAQINRTVAAICSDNRSHAVISNCLVKDFKCELTDEVTTTFVTNNIVLAVMQLASGRYVVEGGSETTNIKNNCVVITDGDLIKNPDAVVDGPNQFRRFNYPLIRHFSNDNDYTSNSMNDVDESNCAFIVCSLTDNPDNINIVANDPRIVKFDANSDDYDGASNKISYKTQSGLEAAIKDFCSQDGCDFDFIKYNFGDEDYPWREKIVNGALDIDITLPLQRSKYWLKQNAAGHYIVEGEGFLQMANMMANKGDDDMYFEFNNGQGGDGYALYGLAVEVPSGCTIDGGATPNSWIEYQEDICPIFSNIQDGAIVKRLSLVINEFDGNYSFSQSADVAQFGFLAYSNSGTIESCDLFYQGGTEVFNIASITPTTDASIGGLVAENNGTIQNISSNIYFDVDAKEDQVISLGAVAGVNNGAIRDVLYKGSVRSISGADNPTISLLETNGKIGLVVGDNTTGTLGNVFVELTADDFEKDSQYKQGFDAFKVILDGYTKVTNETIGVKYKDGDNGQISRDSNEGFIYTRSDKSHFTFLYQQALIDGYNEECADESDKLNADAQNPDIADAYILFTIEDGQSKDSPVIGLFKMPSRWKLNYDNSFYEVELSMDDAEVTTEVQGDGTVVVTEVVVSEPSQFKNALNGIAESPTVYQDAKILLVSDVDLSGVYIQPISTTGNPANVTIDGQDHTLSGVDVSQVASATEAVQHPSDPTKTVEVVNTAGIFGSFGTAAHLKNMNIQATLNISAEGDDIKSKDEVVVPLLAGVNKGIFSDVSASVIVAVDESGFKDGAKIQITPVGNNTENASIKNAFIRVANADLMYKPYNMLKSYYSYFISYLNVQFEKMYSVWCDLVAYLNTYKGKQLLAGKNDADIVTPTFESFCQYARSTNLRVFVMLGTHMSFGDFINTISFNEEAEKAHYLAKRFVEWYYESNQDALRAADKAVWEAYYNKPGNQVCVIATQNLCKSPGKGRAHKVCSIQSAGNKTTTLNPDENVPATEMECTAEQGASGYAAYWLNFLLEGYTGDYVFEWSNGTLYPVLASDKMKPIVKLEYISDNSDEGLNYESFAKQGSKVTIRYTDRPSNITVNGIAVDQAAFEADQVTFTIPAQTDAKGKVKIGITFSVTAIDEPQFASEQSAPQISSSSNVITVRGVTNKQVIISNLQGATLFTQTSPTSRLDITVPVSGIYIVKVGDTAQKVLID